MTTYPYLNAWLQCLLQLTPPRGLVHIGAGGGAQPYPYANMPRLLAVEADPLQQARLQTQLQHQAHCQVMQAVVAAQSGSADFYALSQSLESGLCPAAAVQTLWPNIKTLHANAVPTTTLQALLPQALDSAAAFNWVAIDCLPPDQLLHGAGDLINGWDVLLVRALKEAPAGANAATQAMSLAALRQQLAAFELEFVALEEENHPHMVRALFVRNPAQHLVKAKATFAAALQEQTRLATESQAALTGLQTQHDSLAQEKANLIAASAELTRARDQLIIQINQETTSKAEALAQCNALAQKGAEVHAQRFQFAQENTKLIADNEDLTRARDQLQAQKDAETKARQEALAQRDQLAADKAEALAQRDQLAKEKAALTAARDEQAKLAAERQTALAALQSQHESLAQDNVKQIAASAELTRARDQLQAQKDTETKAKQEALAQRDTEAKAKAEALAQRDAEAKARAEAQAQRDQLAKEKAALAQEKAALIQDKAALTAARDEQAKLAAECQAALSTLQQEAASKQQRLQQLEADNQEYAARQNLLQEELIKAEAQIDLIKDLLLREPGL